MSKVKAAVLVYLLIVVSVNAQERTPFAAEKQLDPAWVTSLTEHGGALDAGVRGSKKEDSLKYIGMPVGGIGCGTVYLGGDGRLWVWDIFNEQHRGVIANRAAAPESLRAIGFTGTISETGGSNYVSPYTPDTLEPQFSQGFGIQVGDTFRRFQASDWATVEFEGKWPLGIVQYSDPAAPVDVTLRAFSPFVPLDLADSSLPVTCMEFTVKNTSSKPIQADLRGWLENAVGLHSSASRNLKKTSQRTSGDSASFLAYGADEEKQESSAPRPDMLFADFEGEDYADWTAKGEAFGSAPVRKDKVPGYQGDIKMHRNGAVNSHATAPGKSVQEKDAKQGTLTSRPFVIERRAISFLIGGGDHKGTTCMNLLIDGKVVCSATGQNSNEMKTKVFAVGKWEGKTAQLQIVDADSASWGNISVDRIVFTDDLAAKASGPWEKAQDAGTMVLSVLDGSAKPCDQGGTPGWSSSLSLKPGEEKKVTFLLSWNFPNLYPLPGFPNQKHYYSTRFADATAVAKHVAKEYPRLRKATMNWVDTWNDSTLPQWLLDRAALTTNTLQTANCYQFEDGQFWAWEGIGSCPGTCTHVWQYAQGLARLFPSLERNLREVTDFGYAFDPKTGIVKHRGKHGGCATDGQAGIILRTLREHQMSPDHSFLKRVWPQCKLALQTLINEDGNGDGILEGGQHNTLDSSWYGPVAWISGHYQAALLAGERMAKEMGDDAFAKQCRTILEKGQPNLMALFDGEYFINRPDPKHPDSVNSGTGCHIDQVFGQSWAFQVGLGRVFPEKECRTALRSLWKYNFIPEVGAYREVNQPGRWYATPGESGLIMCAFPGKDWTYTDARGAKSRSAWSAQYFDECMTGFEYQVASHMVYEGEPDLVEKGLAITRAIHDRYSPAKRNPYNEVECSDHYGRAAASYGVFLAACGFEYDGPSKRIGFAPRVSPENFKAPFTAAEGWGTYSQKQADGHMQAQIAVHYGKLSLRTLVLKMPTGAAATSAQATVDGTPVSCTIKQKDGRTVVQFSNDVVLAEGQTLKVSL